MSDQTTEEPGTGTQTPPDPEPQTPPEGDDGKDDDES